MSRRERARRTREAATSAASALVSPVERLVHVLMSTDLWRPRHQHRLALLMLALAELRPTGRFAYVDATFEQLGRIMKRKAGAVRNAVRDAERLGYIECQRGTVDQYGRHRPSRFFVLWSVIEPVLDEALAAAPRADAEHHAAARQRTKAAQARVAARRRDRAVVALPVNHPGRNPDNRPPAGVSSVGDLKGVTLRRAGGGMSRYLQGALKGDLDSKRKTLAHHEFVDDGQRCCTQCGLPESNVRFHLVRQRQ